MKLLLVTQAVDQEDLRLGFFVRWVEEFARHFEHIEVICLYEGMHALPDNVRVHSLGKEQGRRSRLAYAYAFLKLAWTLRGRYDQVLIHMNQEYALIGGWLFALLAKPVSMWRNHYAGSPLTDIAALFCVRVFCTSKFSYTARYRKTVLMPVGVDTERFQKSLESEPAPRSILFFARMAPSKRADMLIEALGILIEKGVSFTASVYGTPLPEHESYYRNVKARAEALGLHDRVRFHPGVPNDKAPEVFRAHEIFVNCAASGMFDKMIFEAAASGCFSIAASQDWRRLAGDAQYAPSAPELALRLEEYLAQGDRRTARSAQDSIVTAHSLARLGERLAEELARA